MAIFKVCSKCESTNVRVDAWAVWDHENQTWELGEMFDHAHCDDCEGKTTIKSKSKPITPSETEIAALQSYAAERGRRWKSDLELDWYNARLSHCDDMPNRGSILHGLRNNPAFGPAGLVAFRLPKEA